MTARFPGRSAPFVRPFARAEVPSAPAAEPAAVNADLAQGRASDGVEGDERRARPAAPAAASARVSSGPRLECNHQALRLVSRGAGLVPEFKLHCDEPDGVVGPRKGVLWLLPTEPGQLKKRIELDSRGRLPGTRFLDLVPGATLLLSLTGKPTDDIGCIVAPKADGPLVAEGMTFVTHESPLSAHEIEPTNVQQGKLGNCWLIAAYAAVARQRPDALRACLRDVDGGIEARLFGYDAKKRAFVAEPPFTMARTLPFSPARLYGRGRLAPPPDVDAALERPRWTEWSFARMSPWLPFLEKAFATRRGSYEALKSGSSDVAFGALLGAPAMRSPLKDVDEARLEACLRRAEELSLPVVLSSKVDALTDNDKVRDSHAHTLLGVHERDGVTYVKLFDPNAKTLPAANGTEGIFELTLAEVLASCRAVIVAGMPGLDAIVP